MTNKNSLREEWDRSLHLQTPLTDSSTQPNGLNLDIESWMTYKTSLWEKREKNIILFGMVNMNAISRKSKKNQPMKIRAYKRKIRDFTTQHEID